MSGNLPSWPGADVCYSRAYRLLVIWSREIRIVYDRWRGGYYCSPPPHMVDLIDALNAGDEEVIKWTLLQHPEVIS